MSTSKTNDEVSVTGFTGSGTFIIHNATGNEITNVRLTHFLEGSKYTGHASLAIVDRLENVTNSKPFVFWSYEGKDDHWCIAFQNIYGCWQSYDLNASMNKDYVADKYQMLLTNESLTFIATDKGGQTHKSSKSITSVYNGTKV